MTSGPISNEAESMPAVPCASMFESWHWPEHEEKSSRLVYNCVQYVLSDGEHVVMSADAKGIHARGVSAEEAIEDFRSAIVALYSAYVPYSLFACPDLEPRYRSRRQFVSCITSLSLFPCVAILAFVAC